jgi:6-phosphofructokinase
MRKRRIGILTGGGDVQSLNAVLAAAQTTARENKIELLGFRNGWKGVLECSYVLLARKTVPAEIGGTVLRSSRVNIGKIENGTATIRKNLEQLGVEGLIVVGGEDTLSNSFFLRDYPQVLISKTIDNDVGKLPGKGKTFSNSGMVNHFTLGHPTAARKIASFVSLQEGVRTTAYSHERIMIVESMGMHAGWLALSSCMGNPDYIVVPEFPLEYSSFVEKVSQRYKKNRHVIIVVAEGARWSDGSYMSADDSEMDSFGHPKFKGSAAVLAEKLKRDLSPQFDTRNINAINPSYLYRSGKPCNIDMQCASMLGTKSVKLFLGKFTEPTFLSLKEKQKKHILEQIPIRLLSSIDDFHRFLDDRLYDARLLQATKYARKYWKTIVPEFKNVSYGL